MAFTSLVAIDVALEHESISLEPQHQIEEGGYVEVDLQTCAHVIPGNYCATWMTWDPSNDLAFEYLSKAAQYLGSC